MVELSDTKIASVAEQAADALGIVTVVNVKTPAASSRRTTAYRAASVLLVQQGFVLAKREAVDRFTLMVLSEIGVLFTPFARCFARLGKVFTAPPIMADSAARLAVHLVAVSCALRLVELRKRLYGLAARAVLCAGREVEWLPSWHEYSFGVEYSYSRSTLYARSF
jgi:hypothetical protein